MVLQCVTELQLSASSGVGEDPSHGTSRKSPKYLVAFPEERGTSLHFPQIY